MALQVGRVDLANLPAYSDSETELLRRYLNKDHSFRHGRITAERRGLMTTTSASWEARCLRSTAGEISRPFLARQPCCRRLADHTGHAELSMGLRLRRWHLHQLFGVASTVNWPRAILVWYSPCCSGAISATGIHGTTCSAALATPNYTLTAAWVGRPYWHLHHMALGETIGFSTRLSQNNDGSLYDANVDRRGVHIALMGDPTLRMHPVVPPSALLVASNDSGGVI